MASFDRDRTPLYGGELVAEVSSFGFGFMGYVAATRGKQVWVTLQPDPDDAYYAQSIVTDAYDVVVVPIREEPLIA